METRWRFQPHDVGRVQHLQRAAGLAPVVAQLLVSRGFHDPDSASRFLAAKLTDLRDPDELPGVEDAAELVYQAIQQQKRITIYGDYDADGMTATALLLRGLRLLGADVNFYVPNRMEEGYGLNHDALKKLAERKTQQVISVDCGIASVEEAETAHQLGLELIVTDHHEMSNQLPRAAAIVHPRLPGSDYPFSGLCGAGVAFKLMWSVCQRVSQAKRVTERLRNYLLTAVGLAAIGTVADVVPLLDENRVLVRHGLTTLKAQPTAGVSALMKVAGLANKRSLSSDDIGFSLAPRLNAAGRLGQAQLAVELLATDSHERATELAEYLDELNGRRTSLERSIQLAAKKQIDEHHDLDREPALVLAGRGWHAGVIGIVAGRLAEQYHRPVIVLSLDDLNVKHATGSGRSIPGFNLNQALAHCRGHLVAHGGHAAAAGLRIEEKNIDAFRADFYDYVGGQLSSADRIPEVVIDAEAPLPHLTLRTIEQLERLSPFGQDHPRPTLCARAVQLGNRPRKMGKGDQHLSVMLQQGNVRLRSLAFNRGQWAEQLKACGEALDIAYRPVINEFNGRRAVEVHLVDWHPTGRKDTP